MDPVSWAVDFLGRVGAPLTRENVAAIVAWEKAEGGHFANAATYNPLNTTRAGHDGRPIPNNSAGVKAYPTYEDGMAATVETIRLPAYQAVMAALRSGSSAAAVATAVVASPWGTGPLIFSTLAHGHAQAEVWATSSQAGPDAGAPAAAPVSTRVGLPGSVDDAFAALNRLAKLLGQRDTWLRIMKIGGGTAVLVLGLALVFRDSITRAADLVTDVIPQTAAAKAVAGA